MDDGANDIFESAAASFSLLAGISICCLVGMSTVLQLNCECESSQNTELWETMVEFERMIVRLTREGVAVVEVAGAQVSGDNLEVDRAAQSSFLLAESTSLETMSTFSTPLPTDGSSARVSFCVSSVSPDLTCCC